jgi:hypothetical protein
MSHFMIMNRLMRVRENSFLAFDSSESSTRTKEENAMMWFILTPFLVLCLVALGLTLAEAVDHVRARHPESTNIPFADALGSQTPLGNKQSFYPGDLDEGMITVPRGSFTFND